MNKNRNMKETNDKDYETKRSRKGRSGKSRSSRSNGKDRYDKSKDSKMDVGLDNKDRDNDPNYYFLDKGVAEQVSQLSMRNFMGEDVYTSRNGVLNQKIPPIAVAFVNPGAGEARAVTGQARNAGINLAGYRTYTKLAAFTGRALIYAPQDVSTAILAMGEVISCMEFIRRAMGVLYTYNQRNRAYPKSVLYAMFVDPIDLADNYALYRNRFNELVTRINQIPIPKDIAYFDKCAKLYEKIYLDSESPMAQTMFYVPATTWTIDESSYSGGTILKTTGWIMDPTTGARVLNDTNLSHYMDIVSLMIDKLLQSSTLNVLYADILNYFAKSGGSVWLFDYFMDGYQVIPEYNANFMLQWHNSTSVGTVPVFPTYYSGSTGTRVTPYNDVYPDANVNALIYSPAVPKATLQFYPRNLLIDFHTPDPSVEDRIEAARFTFAWDGDTYTDESSQEWAVDMALPDHWIVAYAYTDNSGAVTTVSSTVSTLYPELVSWNHFEEHPFWYLCDANGSTIHIMGDTNYFTTVDYDYIHPILRFIALALYDLRV